MLTATALAISIRLPSGPRKQIDRMGPIAPLLRIRHRTPASLHARYSAAAPTAIDAAASRSPGRNTAAQTISRENMPSAMKYQ